MGGMLQLATGEGTVSTHPSQFSRLFEEYHGLVFRTAYRITGSAADAEDVLQNIFLRLMRSDSAAVIISEESYFRRAAVNASLDVLRARRGELNLPLEEFPSQTRDSQSHELRDCLRRAFAKLAPRSAEMFALRYFEDCTNQQIAHMFNMSPVLVAVTLHRTRRQLQKEIQSYFGGKS
jgi:RNA polymerase sigma-70 factor (ECF subfamily)